MLNAWEGLRNVQSPLVGDGGGFGGRMACTVLWHHSLLGRARLLLGCFAGCIKNCREYNFIKGNLLLFLSDGFIFIDTAKSTTKNAVIGN